MSKKNEITDNLRTSQLLSQLDAALDRSSIMREIVAGYERLRLLESLTGPSRRTRLLRREIEQMESQLHYAR